MQHIKKIIVIEAPLLWLVEIFLSCFYKNVFLKKKNRHRLSYSFLSLQTLISTMPLLSASVGNAWTLPTRSKWKSILSKSALMNAWDDITETANRSSTVRDFSPVDSAASRVELGNRILSTTNHTTTTNSNGVSTVKDIRWRKQLLHFILYLFTLNAAKNFLSFLIGKLQSFDQSLCPTSMVISATNQKCFFCCNWPLRWCHSQLLFFQFIKKSSQLHECYDVADWWKLLNWKI